MSERYAEEIPEIVDRKSRKQKFFRALFIVVNLATVGCLLAIAFKNDSSGGGFGKLFAVASSNLGWLFLAVSLAVLVVVFDGLGYTILMKITSGKLISFGVKTSIVGRYGDAITPLGTGGQPFQMYYLRRKGVSMEYACAMPLVKYIIRVLAADILMILVMAFCVDNTDKTLLIMAIIGLSLNTITPIIMLIFAFNNKIGKWCTEKLVGFLFRLKFVKNKEQTVEKWLEPILALSEAMRQMSTAWKAVFPLAILAVLESLCYFSLPYVICLLFGQSTNYLNLLAQTMIIHNAASFIPTPGASGITDFAFYRIFSMFLSVDIVVSALLLWRIVGFYFYVIIGLIIFLLNKKKCGEAIACDASPKEYDDEQS